MVGSQKIVPDLETALRRLLDYALFWEDTQVRKVMNIASFVGNIVLIEREWIRCWNERDPGSTADSDQER